MIKLNVVGAGKLAKALTKILLQTQGVVLQQLCSRSKESAQAAVDFIGQGRIELDLQQFQAADSYLIAVPDDQIAAIANNLSFLKNIPSHAVIWHCSGVHSSAALNALRERGFAVASLHPAHSFADPIFSTQNFKGTICTLEGDVAAKEVLTHMFVQAGTTLLEIETDQKVLYHAAAVFANNYLVSLLFAAQKIAANAGIDEQYATQLIAQLGRQGLNNWAQKGAVDALTGPVARGDWETVRKHQASLRQMDPVIAELYDRFLPVTQEIAEAKKHKN